VAVTVAALTAGGVVAAVIGLTVIGATVGVWATHRGA
jgi:hypothetical protein